MKTDEVVIGAGVIGGAVALELAKAGRSVVIIDKGSAAGDGSTYASSPYGSVHPRNKQSSGEEFYHATASFAVPLEDVKSNMENWCCDMEYLKFRKGFFNESMPRVRAELLAANRTLSVLRMDGDMYESTVDILYHLYSLVDVGDFIIVDDFGWTSHLWRARDAVVDFRVVHNITARMVDVDGTVAYFRKDKHVTVTLERYPILPSPPLTLADYDRMGTAWEEDAWKGSF